MDYEYGSIALGHAKPAGTEDWPELMGKLVEHVQSTLDGREGGGWELVSHDFVATGDELIATFFIRRPKKESG